MNGVAMFVTIAPEAKEFVAEVAERAGVSQSAFIDELLRHTQATLPDGGIPTWWPHPVAKDEELPLTG